MRPDEARRGQMSSMSSDEVRGGQRRPDEAR